MRVTWDDRLDLDLTAAATCADLVAYLAEHDRAPDSVWCGSVRLDPEHRAGVPPFVHGALLSGSEGPQAVRLSHPHVAVTCGPDAGRMAPLTRAGISIGRGNSCDLALADDAVSHHHLRAGFDVSPWARDARSRNGTVLIRADGTRRRSRRLRPRGGEHLLIGSSVLHVRPAPTVQDADPERPRRATVPQLSTMGAGAMTGILLAVMTGRWYFGLLAIALPLMTIAPALVRRARRIRDTDAAVRPPDDPCPVAPSHAPPDGVALREDLAGPIAVVGGAARATATARGLLLARHVRPHDDSWTEPWMRWLPRATEDRTVLVVPEGQQAPSWAATVVAANVASTDVHQGTSMRRTPTCWVREETAGTLARLIAGTQATEGLLGDVAWADLTMTAATSPGRRVATPIGVSSDGCVALDLDRHGPHVLVAGTTGSGKSALLETLVLGLAHDLSPADLTIALIDFKGGAGLRHCMNLPHVVGCLTDLDGHLAERALISLSAELEQRKRDVAHAGHGSFSEWESAGNAPPRLLVVADEYQEIAQHHHAFLPHLARLAAQGRSLGLHLVLATQRPAGAVTPEIRANVSTTVALRVSSAAESQDLLGDADAALLPVDRPGRAILAHGAHHVTIQVARPTVAVTAPVRRAGLTVESAPADLAAAAAARWRETARPAPLWRDPLPEVVAPPVGRLEDPGAETPARIVVGLGDWPAERRQEYVAWNPAEGPIAVVGPHGSGRTNALEMLGAQAHASGLRPVWLPQDTRAAARTIALTRDRDDVLLLIDDAGVAIAALAECDHGLPADLLRQRLARGSPCALTLSPHDPARLAASASVRVILAGVDPAEQALWNVPRGLTGGATTAGRGLLGSRGLWCEVQMCRAGEAARPEPLVTPLPTGAQVYQLRATRPQLLAIGGDDARCLYLEGDRVTLVGTPSLDRDRALAHIERLARLTPNAPEVSVRDELVTFPGSPRPLGTVVVLRPTERAVRDACGPGHIGLAEISPRDGRAVIVQGSGTHAAQLPVESS